MVILYAGVQSHVGGEERDGSGGEISMDPCQGKPGVDIITKRSSGVEAEWNGGRWRQ